METNPVAVAEGAEARAVVPLAGISKPDVRELGGKARSLVELIQAGLPVPPAFCITTTAFRSFLAAAELLRRVESLTAEDRDGYEAVRRLVRDAPLSNELSDRIRAAYAALGQGRVAVRSSALGEDSAAHSFAGQHDTILNVTGEQEVVNAVRECWASLLSDRARAYRKTDGALGPLEIAVVVQEMVPAEAAGVVFTMDPIDGSPEHLIVEACLGLGEGLVSGRVVSDSFVVDRATGAIVTRQIRYKATRFSTRQSGGVVLEKVPDELRTQPALSDAQVTELARHALQIRERYGAEQDIEWALRDGRFSILQSRPITVRPRRTGPLSPYVGSAGPEIRKGVHFSRMDVGEIFNGMLTPLGLSFARYYQTKVHRDAVAALGMLEPGEAGEHMGYLRGHVYLGVSYLAHVLAQAPVGRDQMPFTARFTSPDVSLAGYSNPYGDHAGKSLLRSGLYWRAYMLRERLTGPRRARRMVASRFAQYDRFRALDLGAMSLDELRAELSRDLKYFHDMHVGYLPFFINSLGVFGQVAQLCGEWLGDSGAALVNRLKGDMSNLRTVASARELWKLARAVDRFPGVRELVLGSPLGEIAPALRADEQGRRFWREEVEPFLRINGVRAREEMELANPRWVDDPSFLFQMVRNYLLNDFSPDGVLQKSREARVVDADAILARLPADRRAHLQGAIAAYCGLSELREETRMAMITSIWLVRGIVYEVGRRLVRDGLLRTLDEVPYLQFEDVLELLEGRRPAREIFTRAKIDEQRRIHLHNLRCPPPPLTLIGEYDPAKRLQAPDPGAEQLKGLGTSAGIVEGRARVIHDLVAQADEFKPGEILVTNFTDASWTGLFAAAGGVVTDIGSVLSHSSIVAREFGIPCVVNTMIATTAIRTGDSVALDGDSGVVRIRRAGSGGA